MPDHAAPVTMLERWKDTEPLRLYLYGITVPLLGVAVIYGWLTTEQLGGWLAVAGALFLGSTVAGELARRQVTSPATLERRLEWQHGASYSAGVQDAMHTTPDVVSAATTELRQVRPKLTCRRVEYGRRCVLEPHGEDTPHHYG